MAERQIRSGGGRMELAEGQILLVSLPPAGLGGECTAIEQQKEKICIRSTAARWTPSFPREPRPYYGRKGCPSLENEIPVQHRITIGRPADGKAGRQAKRSVKNMKILNYGSLNIDYVYDVPTLYNRGRPYMPPPHHPLRRKRTQSISSAGKGRGQGVPCRTHRGGRRFSIGDPQAGGPEAGERFPRRM